MSLAALPQEIRDKILESCLGPGRDFKFGDRKGDGVQSVYYSCVPLAQLRKTNKELWVEASLAWARSHFAKVLVSIRPSVERRIRSAPPSYWISPYTKSIQVEIHVAPRQHTWTHFKSASPKDVLDTVLGWSFEDLLSPHRFIRVELKVVLAYWMHTEDVSTSLDRAIAIHTGTDWKPIQVVSLDRWESKSRVTVCFERSNDTYGSSSGTISILVPRAAA